MGSEQGGQSVLNDIFYVIRLTLPHCMKIFPDIVLSDTINPCFLFLRF